MAKRRTKREMLWMKEEVEQWLLRNDNDPHKAWNAYVKYHLENNLLMVYYIKGIKDFINVSTELTEQMVKEKIEKEYKETMKQNKERLINELKKLSKEEAIQLWKTNKNKLNNEDKITLVDIINMIAEQEYHIEQMHLNLLQKINKKQEQK